MVDVILGLGSNVGDRETMLAAAVRALGGILQNRRVSRIYESQALLPKGAPAGWDIPYLNMAVRGVTALAAQELLEGVKRIECAIGRTPQGHWGPREIDIDILVMGHITMQTPVLTIPHAELLKRDFALVPLAELMPDWRYPGTGNDGGRRAADIAADRGYAIGKNGLRLHG